jgi:hypothetical protein
MATPSGHSHSMTMTANRDFMVGLTADARVEAMNTRQP